MASDPQGYANHSRYVPMYHFVTSGILVINFFWAFYRVVRFPAADTAIALLVAFALLSLFFYAREFALSVQDRVIRLEERLRIAKLAPDLAPRLEEFRRSQLIALRFASDEELPALARRVLDENIRDQNEIKKAVRVWRADHLRA
jgi:hypothetical protein